MFALLTVTRLHVIQTGYVKCAGLRRDIKGTKGDIEMSRALTAGFAAIGMFVAASAGAETLDVTWAVSPYGVVATWQQDSAPSPISYAPDVGTEVQIWNFETDVPIPTLSSIVYYNSSEGVIFSTEIFGGYYVNGPQAYAGSEAAPQFAPGSFSGYFEGNPDNPSTLTFAVPEPSTWALLIAGFAGLGCAYFGGRRAVAA
jgi:hypothetical protein